MKHNIKTNNINNLNSVHLSIAVATPPDWATGVQKWRGVGRTADEE
jgi:hypothetical protein